VSGTMRDLNQAAEDTLTIETLWVANAVLTVERDRLRERLTAIEKVVAEQAEDVAPNPMIIYPTEIYLQQALRRLHRAIQGNP
jgi:hypothetical protein